MRTLSNFWFRLTGRFPRKLPTTGIPELLAYCDRIIEAYGLPKYESYREAIATMILHLGPDRKTGMQPTAVAPRFFAAAVKKAQANEAAFGYLQGQLDARKAKEAEEKANGKTVSGNAGQVDGSATPGSEQPDLGVSDETERGVSA